MRAWWTKMAVPPCPRPGWLVTAGMLAALGASGCAGASLVAARAAEDMSCPEKEIKVTSREMGAYDARGCGKHLSYVVRAGEVLPDDGSDLGHSVRGE
jgi:hypothetical protein